MSKASLWFSIALLASAVLACSKPADLKTDQVVAVNDTLTTTRGAPVQTTNVLANDSDPMGNPFFVTAWTQGALGDVTYDGNGVFTYAPHVSIASGSDSFTYTIQNSLAATATGTVSVTITASWGVPTQLAPNLVNFWKAKGNDAAGHDALGNLTYFWTSSDGTRTKLYSSQVSPAGASSPVTRVDSENLGTGSTISGLQAVADASGNVTAAWMQYDGTRFNNWANRMTAGGTWGTAAKIETDDAGSTSTPSLVVDASGNVTAVWAQSDGTVYNVWANRMTPAGVWGTAQKIETEAAGSADTPQPFVDAGGNVTAVWRKSDGTRYNLRANRFASGAWLATPTALSNGASYVLGFVTAQQTTGANAGALTVVWYQQDVAANLVYAARMNPAGTWTATNQLITADATAGHSTSNPLVYICPSGTATGNVAAIWYQYDGTNYNQWANRMTAAGTWGTATAFSSGGSVWGTWVAGLDAACNVTVVWPQFDGTRYNQWANRMTAAGTWGTAVKIENEDLGDVQPPPSILMDSTTGTTAGNATVLWQQSDGTRYNLWANRYNNNTSSWGTAVKVENEDLGSVNTPQAVIDSSGNVTAVWVQSDGVRTNAWANRMSAAGTWGTSLKLLPSSQGSVTTLPRLLVDSGGVASVAWAQSDGVSRRDVWASRADATGAWAASQNVTSALPYSGTGILDMAFEGATGTAPLLVGTASNGGFTSLWVSDMR